jgi:hypothetical protein
MRVTVPLWGYGLILGVLLRHAAFTSTLRTSPGV